MSFAVPARHALAIGPWDATIGAPVRERTRLDRGPGQPHRPNLFLVHRA
ncbi:hypothetical protein RGAI101_1363 [Roseobacter sp. GAI101]|nr:hypothetical protein RGAI101_1363 [Roseobacter sp. GAI101]